MVQSFMKTEKLINWLAIFIVPIAIFLLSPLWTANFKDTKNLEYTIISESKIAGKDTKFKDWPNIKILYQDKELDEASFIKIHFKNTGNIPVTKEDFHKPLTITFDENSNVAGFRKVVSYPEGLELNSTTDKHSVSIDPLLLNAGDTFLIELFVKGKASIEAITARITGVQDIKESESIERSGLFLELVKQGSKKGHSSHMPITEFNRYALFILSIFLLSITFVSFFSKEEELSPKEYKLKRTLRFGTYISGLSVSSLYGFTYLDTSKFYIVFSLILPVLVSIFVAFILKKYFFEDGEAEEEKA